MSALPKFRRFLDGRLILAYTSEAALVMKSKNKPLGPSQSPDEVSL